MPAQTRFQNPLFFLSCHFPPSRYTFLFPISSTSLLWFIDGKTLARCQAYGGESNNCSNYSYSNSLGFLKDQVGLLLFSSDFVADYPAPNFIALVITSRTRNLLPESGMLQKSNCRTYFSSCPQCQLLNWEGIQFCSFKLDSGILIMSE